MRYKSKSKSNSLAELHFISSLQLEQSARVVGAIANEKHQVTLTEVSPDELKFHINYLPDKSKTAEINGTLQRWNGTETKIDADGVVYRVTDQNDNYQGNGGTATGIIVIAVVSVFIPSTGVFGAFSLPVMLAGLGIGYMLIRDSEEDKEETTVYFRARDYLLQRLIDAFKSAGDVEAL